MRKIKCDDITDAVERLFLEAACRIEPDVIAALDAALLAEKSAVARECLSQIIRNCGVAADTGRPICQDTGMAVVFLDVGQQAAIIGGDLTEAVNEGVKRAYAGGFLRASVLSPLGRVNTRDNTPCVIHARVVPGDGLRIVAAPKGFGSENMSRLYMLTPAQGAPGVLDAIADAVDTAGANPCPPVIAGVGIGGTAEYAMLLAKRALLRRVNQPSPDGELAALEREALRRVNALGIGAMGLGGTVTALAVHIEAFPTHIAGLPVAVNLQCHAARHKEAVL